MNRKRRTPLSLDRKRWAAYVAAGLATAVGSDAKAEITFIEPGAHIVDPDPGDGYFGIAYSLQFSGSQTANLLFLHAKDEVRASHGIFAMRVEGSNGLNQNIAIAGVSSRGYYYGSNVPYGQNISTLGFLDGQNRADMAWGSGYPESQFVDRGGYLAFRFDTGAGTQYGWAEVSLIAGAPINEFTLERIAWGAPGESVFAGQVSPIPEAGSLGLLAFGAVGLSVWRRNRKA
ncbi:MAG: PEP-CTERM sorting domain-containing protein [Planctomycetota bacterium]